MITCCWSPIAVGGCWNEKHERNHIWHTYLDRYGTDSNLFCFDPPDPRRGARGDFRGSKIQKSRKCHEQPRKSINCSFKKNTTPPHPTPGGPSGDFRELAIQKVREMSWTAQKINNLFNSHRPLWLGVLGLKITREGQF